VRPHHIALALGVARPADPAHRWLLPGRVVLVTGGSRGLGLELACEFGRRGAAVAIAARDADTLARARAELEARGVDVLAMPSDVGDAAAATALVTTIIERWWRLDIVVNDAVLTTASTAAITRSRSRASRGRRAS